MEKKCRQYHQLDHSAFHDCSLPRRLGRRKYHFSALFCTTTTFFGARSAQSMMWGVLFTDLGTFVADVGAEAAQSIGHRGTSTHPLAGQHTDIRTLAA
jgi:hypothetical protein